MWPQVTVLITCYLAWMNKINVLRPYLNFTWPRKKKKGLWLASYLDKMTRVTCLAAHNTKIFPKGTFFAYCFEYLLHNGQVVSGCKPTLSNTPKTCLSWETVQFNHLLPFMCSFSDQRKWPQFKWYQNRFIHLLKHLPHCSTTGLLLRLHPTPGDDPLVWVSTAADQ